jgi:hypothetical protein
MPSHFWKYYRGLLKWQQLLAPLVPSHQGPTITIESSMNIKNGQKCSISFENNIPQVTSIHSKAASVSKIQTFRKTVGAEDHGSIVLVPVARGEKKFKRYGLIPRWRGPEKETTWSKSVLFLAAQDSSLNVRDSQELLWCESINSKKKLRNEGSIYDTPTSYPPCPLFHVDMEEWSVIQAHPSVISTLYAFCSWRHTATCTGMIFSEVRT